MFIAEVHQNPSSGSGEIENVKIISIVDGERMDCQTMVDNTALDHSATEQTDGQTE